MTASQDAEALAALKRKEALRANLAERSSRLEAEDGLIRGHAELNTARDEIVALRASLREQTALHTSQVLGQRLCLLYVDDACFAWITNARCV